MTPIDRIPITVLTGFLGSGKTSLLNALLRRPEFRDSAIVVNEFGEIGLDHLLVSSAKENIVLLDAGCLCCAVLDSLKETLADLYHRRARHEIPTFQRVVIETSGLADPGPILRSILRDDLVAHIFRLQNLVCTVDAKFGLGELAAHPEAQAQLALADHIVVTKTDLTGDICPPDLDARIRAVNPHATVQLVRNGDIDGVLLLGDAADGAAPSWVARLDAPHAHQHHHEEDVASVSFRLDRPVTWSGIAAWTDVMRRRYGADLMRCKGILALEDGKPVVLHGVQTMFDTARLRAWPSEDRQSRIVCIGRGLDRPTIAQSLAWLHVPAGTQPPGSGDVLPA
jgi:G3E family GTPase